LQKSKKNKQKKSQLVYLQRSCLIQSQKLKIYFPVPILYNQTFFSILVWEKRQILVDSQDNCWLVNISFQNVFIHICQVYYDWENANENNHWA